MPTAITVASALPTWLTHCEKTGPPGLMASWRSMSWKSWKRSAARRNLAGISRSERLRNDLIYCEIVWSMGDWSSPDGAFSEIRGALSHIEVPALRFASCGLRQMGDLAC